MSQQYITKNQQETETETQTENNESWEYGPRMSRWKRKMIIGPYFSEQA